MKDRVDGFALQLLKEWDGKTVPKNAVVEPKIDGIRALLIFSGDRYCCLSRRGNTLHNVGFVAAELAPYFKGYCLDGELIKGDLSGTMNAVRSGERGHGSDVFFVVFDMLTIEEVDSKRCSRPLSERRKLLERMFPKNPIMTGIIKQFPVKTAAEVTRAMKRFVKAGFEGAVLKDLDTTYKFRRVSDWTKAKPFKSGDYKVVGVEEGKGKHKGKLGSFKVLGPKGRVSRVGSGVTDAQRAQFWKNRKKLVGSVIEVEYQEVTSSGSLRFPTFKRLRPDK